MYGSYKEEALLLLFSLTSRCLPQDDLTRIVTIDSNFFTLPENEYFDRFNQIYFEYQEVTPRTEIINYQNNVNKDFIHVVYGMFD
jgi:hypothetical protein